MALSHEPKHDDERLVDYLLGMLSEQETERLDELSIVDEDVAARLVAVENDLVDAYVRGALTGARLERFKAHYLASPQRRERVKFAEDFIGAVDRTAPPAPSLMRFVPRSVAAWGRVVAAALLLVAGGVLVVNHLQLRSSLDEAQARSASLDRQRHGLEQQLASERAANAETTRELDQARSSLSDAIQKPSTEKPTPTFALVLLPQTRSLGPIPTVAVRSGTSAIPVELQLEANDFAAYSVALNDPATNRVIWRSGRIAAVPVGRTSNVAVEIPAGLLHSQHYSLELSGYGTDRSAQTVTSYTFLVVRR
jgi:hypothetical protein